MSRALLYIDGEYCHTLSKLKGYIIPGPKPNTRLFYELLTLQRNDLLSQWLEQGDSDEEQMLSVVLRGIHKTMNDNQLMDTLAEAFMRSGSNYSTSVDTSYLKLEEVNCIFSRGKIISLTTSDGNSFCGSIDTLIHDNSQSIKCLLRFRLKNKSVSKTYIQLVSSGGDEIYSVLVSLKDYNVGSLVNIVFPSIIINRNNFFQKYNIRIDGVNIADFKLDIVVSDLKLNVHGVSLNMIFVRGGTFMMGASEEQGSDAFPDESPTHEVTLSGFYIGETVVTQKLWRSLMYDDPSTFKGNNCPVVDVEFDDCLDFIDELNDLMKDQLNGLKFRLPTEAEWEFAARGGIQSKRYKYAGGHDIDKVAWYADNSGTLQKVGLKQPNELGLHDMSGNVWEWCSDRYGEYSNDAVRDPKGASSGMDYVLRGGAWGSAASSCRVTNRYKYNPLYQQKGMIGFRLVLSEI